MFFENELLIFNIIDVIEINQKNINIFNHTRQKREVKIFTSLFA